ncbi:unnamed protein product [Lepeophtheirus salmonis]|uniref:(salmon louse) hypothetical protein n=1 Tax=Lepeophtheirus salmonis TaxID=72036 RepID=A0A7R8H3M4_LEPSM|nr:unnamed protein product [Lepeophtheirus salmonis]CAF2832538.1 unnamed protein product [Lepeophtheirus salmonis]
MFPPKVLIPIFWFQYVFLKNVRSSDIVFPSNDYDEQEIEFDLAEFPGNISDIPSYISHLPVEDNHGNPAIEVVETQAIQSSSGRNLQGNDPTAACDSNVVIYTHILVKVYCIS